MLGQTVEYVAADSSWRMYDMLATNEADLALTLWPAKYWNTNRSDALSKLCPRSSTGRCVSIVGVHGYRARCSGWFVTASSPEVRGNLVAWSTITSLLANTSTSKNETTPFARKLTKAHELKVTDLCDTYGNLTEMRHSGRFNWLLDARDAGLIMFGCLRK